MERQRDNRRPAFDHVTAVILAGGQSRRMKTDKCTLPIDGKPLIEHVLSQLTPCFAQVLVSVADPDRFSDLRAEVVADRQGGLGPIMGIISALEVSRHEVNFVQACDIPKTDFALVEEMLSIAKGCDVVMPRTAEQHLEPLFAVYNQSALSALHRVLKKDRGAVHKIADRCHAKFIDLREGHTIRNLNTMSDYTSYLHKHKKADTED